MNAKKGIGLKSILAVVVICLAFSFCSLPFGQTQQVYAETEDINELALLDSLIDEIDIVDNYRLDRTLNVAYGKIYKLQQIYNGIDVYDSELSVCVDNNNNLLSTNGDFVYVHGLAKGDLTLNEIIDILKSQLGNINIFDSKEVIFQSGGHFVFAFALGCDYMGGSELIVSKTDGSVLRTTSLGKGFTSVSIPQEDLLGNVVDVNVVLEDDGTYYLVDVERNIYTYYDDNGTYQLYMNDTGYFEADAISVFNNVITAYDFYADENNIGQSLYGVDNNNMQLNLVVHYGTNLENAEYVAYSDLSVLRVGDGNPYGGIYLPARALDVLAHEYQHGVTTYTAKLKYEGESGALHEGISDIFGALIEGKDPSDPNFWKMGENAVPYGKDCVRSLSGGTYGQVYDYSKINRCYFHADGQHNSSCDYNYVHDNSTIITNVQYRLYQALPDFFTRQTIGTLWYSTLCALNSNSNFKDFAEQFLQATINLSYDVDVVGKVSSVLYSCGLISTPMNISSETHRTVTFQNDDGKVLKRVFVEIGSKFSSIDLSNIALEKQMTEKYYYEFEGWDKDIASIDVVNENITLTAKFSEKLRSFEVKFLDAANNVIDTQNVLYGSSATPPPNPIRQSTDSYDYEFSEWSEDYTNITHDVVISPVYISTRYYIITLISDGEVFDKLRLKEGSEFVVERLPERAPTDEYIYIFAGWDKEIDTVTSDMTLSAHFERKSRIYRVVYMSRGEVYQTIEYYYGEEIILPDIQANGLNFLGWYLNEDTTMNANIQAVTSDLILYAGWNRSYTPLIILFSVFGVLAIAGVITTLILLKKKKTDKHSPQRRY